MVLTPKLIGYPYNSGLFRARIYIFSPWSDILTNQLRGLVDPVQTALQISSTLVLSEGILLCVSLGVMGTYIIFTQ
jgi:hypothetical protein